MSIGRYSFALSYSLSFLSDGIFTICVLLILLDSVREQFHALDLVRDDTKAVLLVALVSLEIDRKHIHYVRP